MVKYIYRPKLVSKPYIRKERLPKVKCTLESLCFKFNSRIIMKVKDVLVAVLLAGNLFAMPFIISLGWHSGKNRALH